MNNPFRILKSCNGDDININVKRIEAVLPRDPYKRHTLLMESGEKIILHNSITFDDLNEILKDVYFYE